MPITTYPLDCGELHILDLDADEYGNFIALMNNMEVWWNSMQLTLPYQFNYAWIRELDAERFLIIGEQVGNPDTGHIFDYTGRKLLSFNAGEYIEDVLVQANRIVVAYFDQAAGERSPTGDGIAVFDFEGQQVFGYVSGGHGFILACYCICKQDNDSVLAYTYTGFPLQELRLTDYRLTQQPTPVDFKGSYALTSDRDNVIFYSSYEDHYSFFWWNRKDRMQRFGHFKLGPRGKLAARIRGIGAGKFLVYDLHSFSIVDAMEMLREEGFHKK
ncbi:hypothetical protein [Hymenobacter norwichensis]|uniref:hypothetical protein n=1 Tax=Hymenobacter norwichensis TaxID=223903 RepID=UPI0003B71AB6|nr:hypothetical protein [Hymenobacter norwichensis]